ncbi:beta-lactamase family protein [Spiractinospora alimapuensis]|uniref:serine hydrolase domain-containing protein n=1 Tax=Spiractinospora alimapuensis TaxID=2820884 RepID=UPI001F24D8B8|nr:serine hydrolase domain-containing protein [Spiractinospora alimapuensis]QVQ54531.1 beta-lactamase family protein [Spiractinospora alimapuensis]
MRDFVRGAVLAFSVAAVTATAGTPVAVGDEEPSATVEEFLAEAVTGDTPGIAVAVVRGDEIVDVSAAGTAGSGRDLTPDTPMRIDSLSKSFTATAVMQLVESGDVELDRPARDYLPEFEVHDPRGADITVRHLLSQTSGMSDATAPPQYRADARTLEEAVERLESASLASEPGTEFEYHNPNYHVLARLVEVVADQDFDAYLEDNVFEPVGMDSTRHVATPAVEVPGLARPHTVAFGHGIPHDEPEYFFGGSGGVVSTARDMANWLWTQNNGGRTRTGDRVLSQESLAETHRPQTPDGPAADYGFGWYHAESAEGPPVRTSHSGAGSGFNSYQGLFPESDYAIAVLTNHGPELMAVQASVQAQNLLAELDPTIPPLSQPGGTLGTDMVLGAATLVTLTGVALGLLRARRWAARRRGRSGVVTVLRLLPLGVVAVFVSLVPVLQLLVLGRTANWSVLTSVLPVGVTWLLTLGVGCVAVLVTRSLLLLAPRPRGLRSPTP